MEEASDLLHKEVAVWKEQRTRSIAKVSRIWR